MCTVHRNRTLSRQYIRNVYCVQKQNTVQTVHQKYLMCTQTEYIPGGTSEICNVNKTQHFPHLNQICVLCTETEHFREGTPEALLTDQKNH